MDGWLIGLAAVSLSLAMWGAILAFRGRIRESRSVPNSLEIQIGGHKSALLLAVCSAVAAAASALLGLAK